MLTDADAATSLPLQPMRADHVARAMDLVLMAGWNQTYADWRLMLAIGEGYGVEDEHGVPESVPEAAVAFRQEEPEDAELLQGVPQRRVEAGLGVGQLAEPVPG